MDIPSNIKWNVDQALLNTKSYLSAILEYLRHPKINDTIIVLI